MRGLMGPLKFDHAHAHVRAFVEDAPDAFGGIYVAHVIRADGRDRVWLYWRPDDSENEYPVAIRSAPAESEEPASDERVTEIAATVWEGRRADWYRAGL